MSVIIGKGKRLNCKGKYLTIKPKEQELPFILTVDTTKYNWGSTNEEDDMIHLHLSETYNYDFTIQWGDGTEDNINNTDVSVSTEISHQYPVPGEYDISISGIFGGLRMYWISNNNEDGKIIDIKQWGSPVWDNAEFAFAGCGNLQISATDIPNFQNVTSFGGFLANCQNLITIPNGLFDNAPQTTTFHQAFDGCQGLTTIPINIITPQKHPLLTSLSYTFRSLWNITGQSPTVWQSWNNGDGPGFEGKPGFVKTQCFGSSSGFSDFGSIPTSWK